LNFLVYYYFNLQLQRYQDGFRGNIRKEIESDKIRREHIGFLEERRSLFLDQRERRRKEGLEVY
ncbi:unnamed protein product, partial [marine sediment metagenome]